MQHILEKQRKRRRRTRLRQLLLRLLFFVFVGASIFGAVIFSPFLRIRHIVILTKGETSSEEIEGVLQGVLAERVFFGMVPRAHIFFLRASYIKEKLQEVFPRIASADVSRSFRGELSIIIKERMVWGIYCDAGLPPEIGKEKCYYMSDDGILFADAPRLTGTVIFRITDHRSHALHLGASPFKNSERNAIQRIRSAVPKYLSVEVEEVTIGLEEDGSLRAYTHDGWYILFDDETSIEKALQNLALVFEKQVANPKNLEYADIRFGEKIFYKVLK